MNSPDMPRNNSEGLNQDPIWLHKPFYPFRLPTAIRGAMAGNYRDVPPGNPMIYSEFNLQTGLPIPVPLIMKVVPTAYVYKEIGIPSGNGIIPKIAIIVAGKDSSAGYQIDLEEFKPESRRKKILGLDKYEQFDILRWNTMFSCIADKADLYNAGMTFRRTYQGKGKKIRIIGIILIKSLTCIY